MKRPSLRGLLSRAGRAVERASPTAAAIWRSARDPMIADALRRGRLRIMASELTTTVGRATRLAEVGVRCVPELVLVDGTTDDGTRVHAAFAVEHAIFAPRGGKELTLAIEPEALDRAAWARQAAAGIAATIAARLGIEVLPSSESLEVAVVREGPGLLRVDLRALGRSRNPVGDMLPIQSVHIVDNAIELALPPLFGKPA
ncbi:MAG: hypothetical protein IT379_19560 [Deltaproteobacteria bacterium]|nr:hypothetical protein [Deltaproteobacteria bacterium]